ncbi:MAG: hypothetical protein NT098_01180 [Candidatus Parcubacteria bacterium]|nr:hypothetical protein [Candidatus Parcubacteria bacterium]
MEKNKFDIGGTIEQKPFEKYSFSKFFEDWCRRNGSVMPEIISREKWEKESQTGLIKKKEDGERKLLIPQDLQLWEMVGITEMIRNEAFANDPEKQKRANEEIQKLGKTFRNAGIYIAQRSHSIEEGREIARALSEELYKYGNALLSGKKETEANPWEKIAEEEFEPDSLAETDKFLAGDALYSSRKERVKEGDNEEEIRQQTLAQFFRTANKAFHLEKKSENNELSLPKEQVEPWKKDAPIHSEFLRKIEDSLKREIEKPKTELVGSVFQKGMELLRTGMPLPMSSSSKDIDRLISFWEKSEASLGETLGVYRMKTELEKIKETGDKISISKKEKEITDKIQRAVSSYAYEKDASYPSSAVETKKIDCAVGSMLAGSFLSQVGIKYLVGDIPEHSILVVSFADGTVEWRGMIVSVRNAKITD